MSIGVTAVHSKYLFNLDFHGIYSESSVLIIRLDSFLNKFEIFWYFSTSISL